MFKYAKPNTHTNIPILYGTPFDNKGPRSVMMIFGDHLQHNKRLPANVVTSVGDEFIDYIQEKWSIPVDPKSITEVINAKSPFC